MPKRSVGALAVAALALVLALGSASVALAAPSDPTLGLAALQTKLDSSITSSVPGYFKTVDKGSTIETIPVTITAITGGPTADSSYIVFEATGPQIDKFGGIVAGMSGSPVYVDDGGVDKVVGAVSYGDYFTKGGTGLATPIEAMRLIQTTYPEFVTLAKPLITSDGLINRIVVAPDPQDFSLAAKQGAFVARPLSAVFIGGLDPASLGYKALARVLSNRGQTVVPLNAPLGSGTSVGDSSFETTLEPGAAVAAMETRGDMWIGGVGTVTYTDTDTVLAFGHSALWSGPSSLYMSNALIDGVWPSTYEPYKMARPERLRGTVTQDRSAGILGMVDQFPAETTITEEAFNADNGTSASSTVYMPRQMLDDGTIDPITGALGAYVAGANLLDAQQTPGSAEITTTVVATDGTTTYTVSIPDHIDDLYDVTFPAIQDAATAISTLQRVPSDGVQKMDLLSVDVQVRFTRRHDWAKIVGIDLPNGLKTGANPVRVSALVFGQPATQTIDATITIPSGTPLTGNVVAVSQSVMAQNWYMGFSESISVGSGSMGDGFITINVPNGPSRMSLGSAVGTLNAILPNNVLSLAYVPSTDGSSQDFGAPDELPYIASSSIVGTVASDWVFNSAAVTSVTQISASAHPGTVAYGGEALLSGTLAGPSAGATVGVYATSPGGSEQYLGSFPTFSDQSEDGPEGLSFEAPVGPLHQTTSFRIHFDGTSNNSSADAVVVIAARARVILGTSATAIKTGRAVTLKASVWPASTAGNGVVFEYNTSGKHWRAISTRTLIGGTSLSTASATWKVAKGKHKIRVRYLGGASNAKTTSAAITMTGK